MKQAPAILRRLAATAAVILTVLGARPTAADESIAVLDAVMGGVPDDARARFESSLEEGLRGAGFVVVPRSVVVERLIQRDAPEGCSFGPCLAAIGKALGVAQVLVARVTAQGPSYSFVFTLVDTTTGAPTRQVADSCAVCTLEEALAAATLAMVSLGTGAGSAEVLPSDAGRDRKAHQRRRAHLTGWTMAAAAVLAAGSGVALTVVDEDTPAVGCYGAAGALAAASLAVLLALD